MAGIDLFDVRELNTRTSGWQYMHQCLELSMPTERENMLPALVQYFDSVLCSISSTLHSLTNVISSFICFLNF